MIDTFTLSSQLRNFGRHAAMRSVNVNTTDAETRQPVRRGTVTGARSEYSIHTPYMTPYETRSMRECVLGCRNENFACEMSPPPPLLASRRRIFMSVITLAPSQETIKNKHIAQDPPQN